MTTTGRVLVLPRAIASEVPCSCGGWPAKPDLRRPFAAFKRALAFAGGGGVVARAMGFLDIDILLFLIWIDEDLIHLVRDGQVDCWL